MNAFTLSNGVQVPAVGFGTFQVYKHAKNGVDPVVSALQCGYRHIDTAKDYGCEKEVGDSLRASGVPRDEIFVTSKVWNTDRGYDKTLRAFEKSCSELALDYLDLYLIHWPASQGDPKQWQAENLDTWRALETLYKQGRIRAIGVSNFMPKHLIPLLEQAEIKPMVDQLEFHPGQMQWKAVDFCQQNGIQVEAWSPLGTGKMLTNETLCSIAEQYHKSVAQLCIRWCLQHDVLPVPKSSTPERIRQNLEIDDFRISDEDMKRIDEMPYFGGSGLDPDEVTEEIFAAMK